MDVENIIPVFPEVGRESAVLAKESISPGLIWSL
jgi:hypothetical protein